jgi:hypothetical protein
VLYLSVVHTLKQPECDPFPKDGPRTWGSTSSRLRPPAMSTRAMFRAMNPSASQVRNAALSWTDALPAGACAHTNAGIQMADRPNPRSNFINALLLLRHADSQARGNLPAASDRKWPRSRVGPLATQLTLVIPGCCKTATTLRDRRKTPPRRHSRHQIRLRDASQPSPRRRTNEQRTLCPPGGRHTMSVAAAATLRDAAFPV